jgi:hypothetical protein
MLPPELTVDSESGSARAMSGNSSKSVKEENIPISTTDRFLVKSELSVFKPKTFLLCLPENQPLRAAMNRRVRVEFHLRSST